MVRRKPDNRKSSTRSTTLREPVIPPESWRNPGAHLETILSNPWYAVIGRLYDEFCFATSGFFRAKGIRNIFVPITTHSISSPIGLGSDSLPVKAIINGDPVYLADSMQFLLELGARIHKQGVYYIACSFRGEDVDERHLAQFAHSEAEIRGSLDDVLNLAGRYVDHLVRHFYEHSHADLWAVADSLSHLERVLAQKGQFPRVRFDEVFKSFGPDSGCFKEVVPDGWAINSIGERRVFNEIGEAVWLTHLPQVTTAFYQQPEIGTASCLSADLLLGGGEVIGAGERCRDQETLLNSLGAHKIKSEDYAWYIQMKKLSPLQTAGYGMGIERFLLWLTQTRDIRNLMLCLRDNRLQYQP